MGQQNFNSEESRKRLEGIGQAMQGAVLKEMGKFQKEMKDIVKNQDMKAAQEVGEKIYGSTFDLNGQISEFEKNLNTIKNMSFGHSNNKT